MDIQARVNESLDNSQANGYEPEKMNVYALVVDLKEFDPELENLSIEELYSPVQKWLSEHGG